MKTSDFGLTCRYSLSTGRIGLAFFDRSLNCIQVGPGDNRRFIFPGSFRSEFRWSRVLNSGLRLESRGYALFTYLGYDLWRTLRNATDWRFRRSWSSGFGGSSPLALWFMVIVG